MVVVAIILHNHPSTTDRSVMTVSVLDHRWSVVVMTAGILLLLLVLVMVWVLVLLLPWLII